MQVDPVKSPENESSGVSNSTITTSHESSTELLPSKKTSPEQPVNSLHQNWCPANQISASWGPRSQIEGQRSLERNIVLVMGAAGSGKSTLVSSVSGHAVEAGSNMGNHTNQCKEWAFDFDGQKVILVDTPSFDNASGTDFDTVNSIVKCVKRLGHVSGVIYLHSIIDKRMTGSAYRNIKILQELCGHEFFPRIILATSMWNGVSQQAFSDACVREKQLQDHFWEPMISKGAQCLRFHGTQDSGKLLIEPFISIPRRSLLAVQKELHTMTLQETGVGRVIMSELRLLEERCQKKTQKGGDHREAQRQALMIREGQGMARQSSVVRYRARLVFDITALFFARIKVILGSLVPRDPETSYQR